MNPNIARLNPYPFERLAALKAGLTPTTNDPHISLSIGEPQHAPPGFLVQALSEADRLAEGLGGYPATRGTAALRGSIARWLTRRFGLDDATIDPDRHVLPVNGTREALFSFAQAMLSGDPNARVLMPNPCYQIYEGAALLRNAQPEFFECPAGTGFVPDFGRVDEQTWKRTELVYICSPGNPSGAVIDLDGLKQLIELADRHDFVIAADECYSEIYYDESQPPLGLLEACHAIDRTDYRRCVVFHSLSKRSNLPGLRSGFVAGDAELLDSYFRYRTYHGCAMPGHVQSVSALAWDDEQHVVANRALYRAKFDAVTPLLATHLDVSIPAGGFYYWAEVPDSDESFTRALFESRNVTVLPGSYLSRVSQGVNPGQSRVRMALVAPLRECLVAAHRVAGFLADDASIPTV